MVIQAWYPLGHGDKALIAEPLFSQLGKKYGKDVREEDIPTMTANAQKDACGLTNPRIMTDAAVAAIYKAAL